MSRKVIIIDTSILCCWLAVPGKETAGPEADRYDKDRVTLILHHEESNGSTFILPIATLIETGNHIAQADNYRYELASSLSEYIRNAADASSPWAAFTDQSALWEQEKLRELADRWPNFAAKRMSIGDVTIVAVAEYYSTAGYSVDIMTGDQGLKAYQPVNPTPIPIRRQ